MLFFLTGEIQTGKTRWLEALIEELGELDVTTYGVIAPGVWVEHVVQAEDSGCDRAIVDCSDGSGDSAQAVRYEKLGIDNVLLPSRERIAFARRADLVNGEDVERYCSQSSQAQLLWSIEDSALDKVNSYFRELILKSAQDEFDRDAPHADNARSSFGRTLVVIDEFGRLELLGGAGLVDAVSLVDNGATQRFPHVLIIVRQQLLETAMERFSGADWGGTCVIGPDDDGREALFSALSV